MKHFFVTGTDTSVGKTFVSAVLVMHAATRFNHVSYYKPIQTGSPPDCDATTVSTLSSDYKNIQASFGEAFKKPLSPHRAAYYDHQHINFSSIKTNAQKQLDKDFTIVEGAGGLMVPLNGRYLMIDLIKEINIPCILVVRSGLGTINHSLLSLETLFSRRIPVWGVVMVGEKNRDNEESVKSYGRVKNFLALPWLDEVNPQSLLALLNQKKAELDEFLFVARFR
jgi:dethiobiotin synthetase